MQDAGLSFVTCPLLFVIRSFPTIVFGAPMGGEKGCLSSSSCNIFALANNPMIQPIRYDRDALKRGFSPRLLLMFVPAPRCAFNLSGIYPMPPLGIAYLAAYLRRSGFFGAALLDIPGSGLSPDRLRSVLTRDRFDLYGLSATLPGLGEAAALSRMIKREVNPEALVVLGGPAASISPRVLFNLLEDIDLVVRGAGEIPLLEIVHRASRGQSFDHIPNAFYRYGSSPPETPGPGSSRHNGHAGPPARDLLPMERYRLHPPFGLFPPATTVETARGCNYACSFCTIPKNVSFRSVDDVMGELSSLAAEGYREIYFIDPTFPIDRARTMDLCRELLRADLGIKWACKSRPDTLDPELLGIMARAGCYMISLGVESGSDLLLKALSKQTTVEQVRRVLRECRKVRIRALSYIIIGAPGETDKTMRDTMRLLVEEKVAFALFSELLPDPTASMFSTRSNGGLEEAAARHYLRDSIQDTFLPGLDVAGIDKAQRRRWLIAANRAFYLRPQYVLQRLLDLRSAREPFIMAKGLYHFFLETARVSRSGTA